MNKKLIFGLIMLWLLVFLYKYAIWENLVFYVDDFMKYGAKIYDFSRFCAIFSFPFLLSLLFLYCFKKYKNNYINNVQHILKILIGIAVFFTFGGLLWVCPKLTEYLPVLNGTLGVFILLETIFSVSQMLLFIALLIFAFGKINTPKESNL